MKKLLLFILCALLVGVSAQAQETDPFDPFSPEVEAAIRAANPDLLNDTRADEEKDAETLLLEAQALFINERPVDARTKLLIALRKDPKNYHTHLMLAGYYIQHVGHFRLALKYNLQALKLFLEKNGPPPYQSSLTKREHMQILYLLSQTRLNLDNYQGALDTLDEFTSYGYYDVWYPGTRAWVLMKLGQVKDAIKVARLGLISDSERGRTLNMLGILLSMDGEREQSLKVFREAIEYELSLGKEGQPATPLNNSGEVFRELFLDDRAESAWRRATALPDGCEHVLPSLNLATILIEQMNYRGASQAIDNFETCVAQFPLRNGEEHRALVNLARGRIALLTGNVDIAIKDLEAALESRQWFGKIGTDEEDLEAGALISLSQALTAKNNLLKLTLPAGWKDSIAIRAERIGNSIRAWWLMRRARELMAEDLKDLEDLQIRNTDSLIEYSTFGDLLAGLPPKLLEKRIEKESDQRQQAFPYYNAYRGQNLIAHGRTAEGMELLNLAESEARSQFDRALLVQIRLLKLAQQDQRSDTYREGAEAVFAAGRARLRTAGLRLPVQLRSDDSVPDSVINAFERSAFVLADSPALQYSVSYRFVDGQHEFSFKGIEGTPGNVTVRGDDLNETINKFSDEVFSEEFSRPVVQKTEKEK